MQGESGCHALAYDQVLLRLSASPHGLSQCEAERRLRDVGLNQLIEKPRPGLLARFIAQLGDLITQVLLAATAVSGLMGEYADAAIIVAIVLLNSVLGLLQEWRAEKALVALKKLASPTVTVRRDGDEGTIAVSQLVPGDMVLLTAGDRIPANVRLGQAWSFEVDEAALIVAAEKAKLDATASLVKELPFDSQRMLMSVVVKDQSGKHQVFTKGAPDALFALCTEYREKGRGTKLTPAILATLQRKNEELAARGLRVLGVACREYRGNLDRAEAADIELGLTFVGLVGMHDPPRPEVRATLKKCRMAGIRVIMVTGDHALTALAIAREIELVGKEARAVTGTELKAMSDDELADVVSRVNVFARVSPECKLRLVRTLRRLGAVVAMTGDGINDAPALKEADIGVSMGQCGTEVAREASALVLQDDNFATIVKAIEEGRGIYDNIRKFIRYLLSCNVGECWLFSSPWL
ncbi:MAG: Calcium-transporting ATPase [Firmicutes bacterium]|nr:Calcium-transporting ATPase [Bacillota bacterium]